MTTQPRLKAGEPAGSNEPSDAEITTGTIAFTSHDGVGGVTVNGVSVLGATAAVASPSPGIFIAAASDARGTLHTARWTLVGWSPFTPV